MTKKSEPVPVPAELPGTPEALALGCTCPMIDNHHGQGAPSRKGRVWWVNEGCPLHWPKDQEEPSV